MVDDDEQDRDPGTVRRRWPWWHRQSTTTRRAIRTSLALVATFLVSAVAGVLTASTESSLGPHAADYSVTTQHEVVVDLGPLGSVLLDSPLPWPLGVEVVVHEIPMELTAVPTSPVTGLAGDLAAYTQVAAHPRAVVADAASALVWDAVGRTVLIWSALLVVIAVGRLASRGLLRREVAAAARRPGVAPLAGAVVVSLVAIPTAGTLLNRPPEGRTIGALAGTPMEDLRMTGRMAQLIDTYGGYLVEAYEENEEFYATVTENLEAAYAQNRAPVRPPGIPIVSPTPTDTATAPPTDAPTPTDAATATAPPTDAPTPDGAETVATATPTPASRARVEPVTFLQVSDLHCNVGMASVIARAAELSGAQAVLDTGDTVMSGTSVESYCVNAFAGEMPEDIPMVVFTGNHR